MAKVQVKQGVLVGNEANTVNGIEYYEFLQIPYAEPPLGNLRFKSPRPPSSWNGERDATCVNVNNVAPQIGFARKFEGSEDCLYLNVYSPKHATSKGELLPVMVFIHGGGFVLGNGIEKSSLGVDCFVEQNIVCVCINYRLGAFGFLSLDIPEASGNMGLKDQVTALQWVQENIMAFGGDKSNVTITGVSAGSASVEYHILSESSKGLFAKGILQSGSALNHWAHQPDVKEYSLKLAQNLGFEGSISDILSVHKFLMEQSMEAIVEETHKMETQIVGAVNLIFVPSVEKAFKNDDAFLTRLPYELLKEGKFNRVPIIRGFAEYEGSFTQSIKFHTIRTLQKKKNFTTLWKHYLDSDDSEKYNKEFQNLYFDGAANDDDEKWGAIDFFSDFDFVSGIITSSKLMALYNVPVYSYVYAFSRAVSMLGAMFNIDRKGAGHCDDVPYTIDYKIPGFEYKFTDTDILMKKRINKLWSNFVKTGNPTPDCTDKDLPVLWPLFTNDDQKYLVIDETMYLRNGYQPKKIALFEEIYDKYLY